MPRMEKGRVVMRCPYSPNRTPDSLPSSQGPDLTAWMWPMAVALKHPFKVQMFKLIAIDRQNQRKCLIFRNVFRKRVWFTRAEELVRGALLATPPSSQGKSFVTQGVQGTLRRDGRISASKHRLESQCHLLGSSATQISTKETLLTAKGVQV